MKTLNFKKLTVSALTIAMGAGLAGAISGTFAWYQYSTRATTAFVGTSIGTSRSLQVAVNSTDESKYKENYRIADTAAEIANDKLSPVTTGTGDQAKDGALNTLKGHPVYRSTDPANWKNAVMNADYVQFTLNFRVMDSVNGAAAAAQSGKTVYLKQIVIGMDGTENDTTDLYKAVRVHLAAGSTYALIGNTGASGNDSSLATNGQLDLNGDNAKDTAKVFEWDNDDTPLEYGAGTQSYYTPAGVACDDSDPYAVTGGFNFGVATPLVVTIFLEGWELLGSTPSADWSTEYLGEHFHVGMEFVTNAELQ
jgi:hypothetical protein